MRHDTFMLPSLKSGMSHFLTNSPSYTKCSGNAGEGLFAKTDIPRGSLVALFNGVRQHTMPGQLDTRAWSDYRIENGDNTDMDILPGQEDLSVYCATLGHKVNNSFDNNCTFARYWHPRFGGNCFSSVKVILMILDLETL